MAPAGCVISRLGIQATASEERVHGLICLRVSIPAQTDASHPNRWALFSSNPPLLLSPPSIHPIPLPTAFPSSRQIKTRTSSSRALLIASTLLSLPQPSGYPPQSPGVQPSLDVSRTTGQVSVVLGSSSGSIGKRGHKNVEGASEGKREWLVIMEFEAPMEQTRRGTMQVHLPLPKCVYSVIRLQIIPPHASSSSSRTSGEVSIITEPKMLALPPSTFDSLPLPFPYVEERERHQNGQVEKRGFEDGWEDGEDLRHHDELGDDSSTDGEDDDVGSWLEGRFQGADTLRLEWSFTGDSSSQPRLQFMPQWHPHTPSIAVSYETSLEADTSLASLEVVQPDGWGWQELHIEGQGLSSWRSSDGEWWDSTRLTSNARSELDLMSDDDADLTAQEDSFSTVRNPRRPVSSPPATTSTPAFSSASLMRQPYPISLEQIEDFSFEMNSEEYGHRRPGQDASGTSHRSPSPSVQPATPPARLGHHQRDGSPTATRPLIPPEPLAGRFFDLYYDTDGATSRRSVTLQGVLVPLSPLLLVSAAEQVSIPFVRLEVGGVNAGQDCLVACPGASADNVALGDEEVLRDTSQGIIGSFSWFDDIGNAVRPPIEEAIRGSVRVRISRTVWGGQSMSIIIPWSKRTSELAFTIGISGTIRIEKAIMHGQEILRSLHKDGDGWAVRLGRGGCPGDMVEVVIAIGQGELDHIPLPSFANANGKMIVDLRGDGWERVLKTAETNLTRSPTSPASFTYDLPFTTPPYIKLRSSPAQSANVKKRSRYSGSTLFSPSTFLYLLLLWMIISLGQQVQRLRNEVAFVAEEARDLRHYGFGQVHDEKHSQSRGQDAPPRHDKHPMSGSAISTGEGTGTSLADDKSKVNATSPGPDRSSTVVDLSDTILADHGEDGSSAAQSIRETTTSLAPLSQAPIHSDHMASSHRHPHAPSTHMSTSLGRVVFGSSGWDQWSSHPTIKTISHGVSWVWKTVVWLVLAR